MLSIQFQLEFASRAALPAEAGAWWMPGLLSGPTQPLRSALVGVATREARPSLYRLNDGIVWIVNPNQSSSSRDVFRNLPGVSPLPLVDVLHNETESLWIPAGGKIQPQVPSEMIHRLLPDLATEVWLPHLGRLRLENEDRLHLTQFFRVPRDSQPWTKVAEPRILFPRICDLQFEQSLEGLMMLQDGNEDIGSLADQIGKVRGPNSKLSRMVEWMKGRAAKDGSESNKLSSAMSAGASFGAEMLERLMNSPAGRLLQQQREEQIEKLLRMMETDPDQALRYALPLGGDGGFRGLSSPGGRLTAHGTDFSLGGLAGGGAIDAWNLDQKRQAELRRAYQQQVQREEAAGRYRRAAYVAAELLGDYASAARLLEKGGFYIEAAAIHKHKLNRPRDQARCLERGGMWEQAGEVYAQQGDYVAVGDLLTRVEQFEEAENAYREAVERANANGRTMEAAGLLDEKLGERESAITLLLEQWPRGTFAKEAGAKIFDWFSTDAQHDRALQCFEDLSSQSRPEDALLMGHLAQSLATNYPDRNVQRLAEDRCRVVLANGIESCARIEQSERIKLIMGLPDFDRQLLRDAAKFDQQLGQQRVLSDPRRPEILSNTKELIQFSRSHRLPVDDCLFAARKQNRIVALGHHRNQLRAVSLTLGNQAFEQLPIADYDLSGMNVSFATHSARTEVYVFGDGVIRTSDRQPEFRQGHSAWPIVFCDQLVTGSMHAATVRRDGCLVGLEWSIDGRLSSRLMNVNNGPQPVETVDITQTLLDGMLEAHEDSFLSADPEDLHRSPLAMSMRLMSVGQLVVLNVGAKMFIFDVVKLTPLDSLASEALHWSQAAPGTQPRLLIVDSEGLLTLSPDLNQLACLERIAEGEFIGAQLLHGGFMVAISESSWTLFRNGRHGYKRCGEGGLPDAPDGRPIEMVSIGAKQFAIVYSNGVVQCANVAM